MFDDKGGEMYPKSKQIVWGRNANSLGEKCTLNDAISKRGRDGKCNAKGSVMIGGGT